MNGAITDPWANTKSPPINNNTKIIGVSHNFLRTRKNINNSLMIWIMSEILN